MLRKNKYIPSQASLASTQPVLPILEGRTCRKDFNQRLKGDTNCLINIGPKREEFCWSESCSERVVATEIEPHLAPAPGRNTKGGTTDETAFNSCETLLTPRYAAVLHTCSVHRHLQQKENCACCKEKPVSREEVIPNSYNLCLPAWTSYSVLTKSPRKGAVSFNLLVTKVNMKLDMLFKTWTPYTVSPKWSLPISTDGKSHSYEG